jgi:chaperonin GroEL
MCVPPLRQRLDKCADADERAAVRMVIEALAQPFRTIVENAGYDPASVLAQLNSAPPGSGLDARSGQIVDMVEAGILDSAAAVRSAAHMAITGAALLLTVDVLIHHHKPQIAMEP